MSAVAELKELQETMYQDYLDKTGFHKKVGEFLFKCRDQEGLSEEDIKKIGIEAYKSARESFNSKLTSAIHKAKEKHDNLSR